MSPVSRAIAAVSAAALALASASCAGTLSMLPGSSPAPSPGAPASLSASKPAATVAGSALPGPKPSAKPGAAPREILPLSLAGLARTSPESRANGAVAASYKGASGQAELDVRLFKAPKASEPGVEAASAASGAAMALKGAELLSIQDVSFDCGGLIIEGIAYEYMGRGGYGGATRDLRLVVYLLHHGEDRALVAARYPEESLHEGRRSAEHLIMALRWPLAL